MLMLPHDTLNVAPHVGKCGRDARFVQTKTRSVENVQAYCAKQNSNALRYAAIGRKGIRFLFRNPARNR